ncbi:MAG: RNA 3'-terminal phosphate cyclase [Aquificaceae bacterium]|nr:MAG: RNA 3'-terminal phosphate cyclase [Aquificaceae bacterium]
MSRIVIDGSIGEGGGQILRTALFMSALLTIPVEIKNIRIKRKPKGLKKQHLGVIKALKYITNAKVEGDYEGSTSLVFEPKTLKSGAYRINLETAGSISLFFQTVLPLSFFVPKRFLIAVKGGTDVENAPTVDWVQNVFLPILEPLANRVSFRVIRRGFYPEGGGFVSLQVESKLQYPLYGLDEIRTFARSHLKIEKNSQGRIEKIRGISVAHKHLQERKVAERQRLGAIEFIKEKLGRKASISNFYVDADCLGTSVTLWIKDDKGNILGSDSKGKKGKLAEIVGKEAAEKLIEDWESGATVDRHLADHLIPILAIVGGTIKVPKFTSHLLTNIEVVKHFVGDIFEIDQSEGLVSAKV